MWKDVLVYNYEGVHFSNVVKQTKESTGTSSTVVNFVHNPFVARRFETKWTTGEVAKKVL